jgi:NADPH:quinone reductase-like Zn-dependent oxidoreductase
VVHATVSSDRKAAVARELGAHRAINYRTSGVDDYVREATGGRGYDVVFDTIGGANIAPSLEAVATNGRVATIVSAGAAPDLTPLHLKNASLHVILMLIPMLNGRDYDRHGTILERVAALVEVGAIKPMLDSTRFTLDQVGRAHDRLKNGQAIGKLVLDVCDADAL